MLRVAVARISFDDNAIRYVVPVLRMTSCLPIIAHAKATLIERILKVTRQGAASGRNHDSMIVLLLHAIAVRYRR